MIKLMSVVVLLGGMLAGSLCGETRAAEEPAPAHTTGQAPQNEGAARAQDGSGPANAAQAGETASTHPAASGEEKLAEKSEVKQSGSMVITLNGSVVYSSGSLLKKEADAQIKEMTEQLRRAENSAEASVSGSSRTHTFGTNADSVLTTKVWSTAPALDASGAVIPGQKQSREIQISNGRIVKVSFENQNLNECLKALAQAAAAHGIKLELPAANPDDIKVSLELADVSLRDAIIKLLEQARLQAGKTKNPPVPATENASGSKNEF